MIEITHLYKTYPGIQPVHALQDLTMSIGEGEFVL
jgi:ABC-type Na+ transport system ATPase subunit NatA